MVSPRPERIARGVRLRARVRRHRGHAVHCPICGHDYDGWAPDVDGVAAVCWRCGAHARHRAIWLLWRTRPELLAGARSLLHFAPEWSLRHQLACRPGLRYVTTDLSAPDVDVHQDITAMTALDGEFGAVVCSHVLEHVPDDAAAMRELCRVTARGGWCLVMTPLALDLESTREDASIVDPVERARAFSRPDHVRMYGTDIARRLAAAGFAVQRIDPEPEFGTAECTRSGIGAHEIIWLCRPGLDGGQPT